jgi:hypothetical protein
VSWRDKLRALFRRVPESVRFDEHAVVRTMRNGRTETVRWATLQSVSIVTTSDGPWGDDFFFVLEDAAGGCAMPQLAQGTDALLARLQELPGFDNEVFLAAVGCTDDARFVCWRRDADALNASDA